MTKKITKNLFIVEGSTDKKFMKQFIELFINNENLSNEDNSYEVVIIDEIIYETNQGSKGGGGKSKFFKGDLIFANIKQKGNDQILPKTSLIVDADWGIHDGPNQPAGYSKVKSELEEIQKQVKKNISDTYPFASEEFEIDHFVIPFNGKNQEYGELETLFINSLKPEFQTKLDCLDQLEDCLNSKLPKPIIKDHQRDKIRMEILLKFYDNKLEKITNWIDYNNKNLDDLKKFLTKKFVKKSKLKK